MYLSSTPVFLVDPIRALENIRRMAAKARTSGVVFRPHFKTHQSKAIGRWFREEGVTKITVSSLEMARYFAQDGWNDITIAFPVKPSEIPELNALARLVRLGLLVESVGVTGLLLEGIHEPANLWIKIDTGYRRTGIDSENPAEASKILLAVRSSKNLVVRGLLTHAGNTYHARSKPEIKRIFADSIWRLNRLREEIQTDHPPLLLSVGDTPGCSLAVSFEGVDEVRPGNFVFYDGMQRGLGSCTYNDIAGVVVCEVVAIHPQRQQVVIHGGSIHFSKEHLHLRGETLFGEMVSLVHEGWSKPVPGCKLISLSQEHGILKLSGSMMNKIRIGDLVGIIPVHSCLTANQLPMLSVSGYHSLDHLNK